MRGWKDSNPRISEVTACLRFTEQLNSEPKNISNSGISWRQRQKGDAR